MEAAATTTTTTSMLHTDLPAVTTTTPTLLLPTTTPLSAMHSHSSQLQTPPSTPLTPSMYHLDLYDNNIDNIDIQADLETSSLELIPCPICSRTFNPATLDKHVGICEKTTTRKRNVFASWRQRREGTELATYPLPKNFGLPTGTTAANRHERGQSPKLQQISSPILTRKKSSDDFVRSTARTSMRKLSNASSTPSTTTINSTATAVSAPGNFARDRMRSSERSLGKRSIQPPPAEQCPHCDRCFGIKAYDRHVEWCKEKALQASIKQTSKNEQNVAKERLEARTKYRAPCLKTKRSMNRDKYSGLAGDENDVVDHFKNNMMSLSMTSSLTSESGLPDRYDPFLSAKRQLEDLCSPTSPNAPHTNVLHSTPTTPLVTAAIPHKMSTSLTLGSSSAHTSPLTPSNAQNRLNTNNQMAAQKSNFRRTSSLRGPRRSPMLSSRPLFAQKHRPTIQRGLSDEGPISTNFLKPEEYDEMPVRSVCVNDFAITNSPRVVRRDTSNSNRKHHHKLPLTVGNNNVRATADVAIGAANANSSDERLTTASKYLSKTDSLAVFLKYENELEQHNAANAPTSASAKAVSEATVSGSSAQAQNLDNPVITKELKDKSNTLSKQNSAKSIKLEAAETPNANLIADSSKVLKQLPMSEKTPVAPAKENHEALNQQSNKITQVRLEPISKPNVLLPKAPIPLTKPSSGILLKTTPPVSNQLPVVSQPINLNAIFGEPKHNHATQLHTKERKLHSASTEYIDPKLINKCDNLPVSSVRKLKSADSDSSEPRNNDSSSASSESNAPVSQLTKLLPLSMLGADHNPQQTTQTNSSIAAAQPQEQTHSAQGGNPVAASLSQRNSAEGRNLLKRKMRLGRNQFLYDASPEADSCSADDEANRSSVEYDDKQFNTSIFNNPLRSAQQHYQLQQQQQQQQQQHQHQQIPPNIPPLPIFDDFDFEEFLSSFEHDDEQFPLFKGCREFLLNRTSNKQRSTLTPNSNSNQLPNNNNSTHKTHHQIKPAYISPTVFPTHATHFQFPSLNTSKNPCPLLLTTSSLRSNSTLSNKDQTHQQANTKYDELLKSSNVATNELYDNFNNNNLVAAADDDEQKKREIFISIETEQNDLSRSPISPNSIRNIVGNPQAVVEVEVDACDNKFSKFSDDEPLPPTTPNQCNKLRSPFNNTNHLPNVQLNNAKNLIQRMQDDFRQMSEDVGSSIRQSVVNTPATNASAMLFGDVGKKMTPSGDADAADSDDMSSLDGYPISAQSSRRGVGSKLSADSAYGSLSRQRSSELPTHRGLSRTRPTTTNSATNTTIPTPAAMMDAGTQHQLQQQQLHQQPHKYSAMKSRSRQFSGGSSSSSSDNSLPPIVSHSNNLNNCSNNNYQQQLQQLQQQQQQHHQEQQLSQLYSNSNNNNNNNNNSNNNLRYESSRSHSINNNRNCESPLSSPTAITSAGNNNNYNSMPNSMSNSMSNSSPAMSASMIMKMSKFCHECGSKFVIEQAKFCMDCGVRRVVL